MDGGSPLACLRGKDQYELAGLVTFGTSCSHDRSPSLFTNVSKHVRWIKENYEIMKKKRNNWSKINAFALYFDNVSTFDVSG